MRYLWLLLTYLGHVVGQFDGQCRLNAIPWRGQRVFKLGVLAIRGVDIAFADFNSTARYLTEAIGSDFDPPISFEIDPVAFGEVSVIDRFVSGEYDFIFANPSISSCIDSEIGTNSLVSMISKRKVNSKEYELTRFGGVMFTRADNDSINSIYDIAGKSTACVSITGLGSGQMQFRELQKVGLHHLQDPKQVIFMENQVNVVMGVLEGKVDVGYVRTDQLERTKDPATGELVDLSLIKVIDPREGLMVDGIPFPFSSSTSLYPEWNIAALSHVDDEVARKFQEAMLQMSRHAATAPSLLDCQESLQCEDESCYSQCFSFLDPGLIKSCNTNPRLSLLAHEAMTKGKNAGWRTTLSYLELRNMQEETGFIKLSSPVKCLRSNEVADAVVCPENHFKKTNEQIARGCEEQGLPCHGFQCICRPCVPSYDVNFYPTSGFEVGTLGCEKFSRCATIEHKQMLTFRAVDNKNRNATFSASVHVGLGTESKSYSMKQIQGEEQFVYELIVDTSDFIVGLYIVEVFVDNVPIPESPFRFEILPRDCVAVTGSCVLLSKLLTGILVPLALLLVTLCHLNHQQKKREADSIWRIDPKEVIFQDPPEVLGRGSFGVVLLAKYRGTDVAVKHAIGRTENKDAGPLQSVRESDLLGPESLFNSSAIFSSSAATSDLSSDGGTSSRMVKILSGHLSAILSPCFESNNMIDEIRNVSKLRHPCITTVMGAVMTSAAGPMMVLEYMSLGSLYDLLHNDSMILEAETIFPILNDIAKGLRFLHESTPEVIHGDLKSKNVLIDGQFRAKISDFGLAAIGHSDENRAVGTPFFMAPELLRKESKNTIESDMFALGILLYEVYSRKIPYHDIDSPMREILKLIADKDTNLRPPVPQSCPPQIADLMRGCLNGSPLLRPTAQQADEAIRMSSVSSSKTDSLLSQIFPSKVAEALREGRKIEPTAHDCVTVFFSDIVGYTEISSELSATKVTDLLDRLYTKYDRLCALHDVFKVETVGDAYMTVTNLTSKQPDHVRVMAHFAIDVLNAASTTLVDEQDPSRGHVQVRAGFHSGPVASHVIGQSNPRYSIIGDTVNVAARMESYSKAGRIHCSSDSAKMLDKLCTDVEIKRRGKILVKGKGEMVTYWIRPNNSFDPTLSNFETDSLLLEDSDVGEFPTKEKPIEKNDSKKRLVDWSTNVLSKYLKQILAFRNASKVKDSGAVNVAPAETRLTVSTIDEVKEVIMLPSYDAERMRLMKDDIHNVQLSSSVLEQLRRFISRICNMYRGNAFHNFEHASHVLLSIDKLLTSVISPPELENVDPRRRDYTVYQYTYGISSDPWVHFSVVFSALIHDVDHPGVPNAQLVKEGDATALQYKNKCVAEQNSIDLAWGILMEPQFEELRDSIAANSSEMARFRQLVVNTVVATDIADKEQKQLRNQRWTLAFSESTEESSTEMMNRKATIVIEHLIQASDVAHTMQNWHVYRKWNQLLFLESYEAFVNGRAGEDPSIKWFENELGFYDFYIIPLTRKLKECGVFGASSSEYLDMATRNRAEWEVRGREVVSEMVERVQAAMRRRNATNNDASSLGSDGTDPLSDIDVISSPSKNAIAWITSKFNSPQKPRRPSLS